MTPTTRLWRLVAALVVTLVLLAPAALAQSPASKVSKARTELKRQRAKQEAVEDKLRPIKAQQRSASARLYAAQQRLEDGEADLRATQLRYDQAEDELAATRGRLAKVERELKANKERFWKRMAVFYKQGRLGYVEVVLGAADFEQFVDRSVLLRRIAESDIALRQRIEAQRAERVALVSRQADIVKQTQQLKAQAAERAAELRQARDERQDVLDEVLSQREPLDAIYAEIQETQRELQRMIARLTMPVLGGGGGGSFGGRFLRPVSGRITCAFGWRIHPILRTRRFHDGVDIGAAHGTTIRAAAAGTVVHSGWMRAYGNTIMINHGGGYVTMYGHCSSLLVGDGASVTAGQPIARVGSTGWSTGPHLHFTVYKDGSAVNPLR